MDEKLLAARYGVFRDSEAQVFGIGRQRNGVVKGYRMTRGVHCVLPPPWSAAARMTAAVLMGGEGALLTGDAWRQAVGVLALRPLAPVQVLVDHDRRPRDSGFARFSRGRSIEAAGHGERQRHAHPLARDVGVASARSTVTRFAAEWRREETRALLAELSQKRMTSPAEVLEWTALHPGLPGARAAAWAARELGGGQDSEGEVRFLKLAHDIGLPPDAGHVTICSGGELLSVTDAWWDIGVPGYYDGKLHFAAARVEADLGRRDLMRDAGLRPFIATHATVRDRALFESRLRTRQREAAEASAKLWRRTGDTVELFPPAA